MCVSKTQACFSTPACEQPVTPSLSLAEPLFPIFLSRGDDQVSMKCSLSS